MKKMFLTATICLLLVSCADKINVGECTQDAHVYGFFGGFWHGVIAPFAFIGSLFSSDIAVYATNNNGGWYAFGFLLGIGALTGGASSSTKKK